MLTIIALAAGMQVVGVPAAPDKFAVQEEITVIGKKLQAWRGLLKTKAGVVRCVTKKSTGDREIDQVGCTAMASCFAKFEGELKAAVSTDDKVARDRMNAETNQRLTACVAERHDRLVEELADKRAAERS